MFTDARDLPADATVDADLCIVGAGSPGISIAREFIGRGPSVILLEGGGLEFTGAGDVARHYATWRAGGPPEIFGIDVMAEQEPSPTSRVRLGRWRDRLGIPKTIVDWRLTNHDRWSIRRTVDIVSEAVSRAGLGRVISTVGAGGQPSAVFGNWHQLGTTRMHPDPKHGVVDQDSRVHDTENLFVAGGSVFPTGGYANPSLTIVALALRLAEHLGDLNL